MHTVGQLIAQLAHLDPNTPVGVVDIIRNPGSQRAMISLRQIVDIDTIHDETSGAPLAAWISVASAATPELPTAPARVVLHSTPCGCLIPVEFSSGTSVNLDAFTCPHHHPDDLVVRSSRR